ncbi:NTP transferase domain-containing protein [Pseudaminobacter sp. NGMCC 1.201702]|uniref:NTP transferase domain-containing protein n=1 Tax=Pseudaminobacter sp. NGMCC 1.201702 TaxID=3391825 RepID=UPI0039EE0D04
MKFGPVPVGEAEGTILAHTTMAGDKRLRKAHVLTAEDIAVLQAAGFKEIVVAILDKDDVEENEAATLIAEALQFSGVVAKPATTGRVNLYAEQAGLFTVDKHLIDAINHVDPSVTVATVAAYASVLADQMVATVKIIPYAVPAPVMREVLTLADGREAFSVRPFRPRSVGVIQTVLPSVKASVLDKTLRVTEARLGRTGSHVVAERRTPHAAEEVATAIRELSDQTDMVLVFGASAMSDPEDVIPAAIRASGGTVFRAGMPVDPGNLFVLGERDGKPLLGAPGCARSPKENGFDWVLDRLIADVEVTKDDIADMGVGGLLMEIPARPEPRDASPKPMRRNVYAVVLAAGRSSRMGGPNKLMALFADRPLIRQTVERVKVSRAAGTIVVTGHQSERIETALSGLDVRFAHNPDFASGLSSSLKVGLAALPADAAGALIVLGDMPGVTTADFDRVIDAFKSDAAMPIVRATHNGKRGNPVLLPKSVFPAVAALQGDTGARHLVENEGENVIDVEIGAGAAVDVDTRDAMSHAGGVLQET